MLQHKLSVHKTANIFTLGDISSSNKIWIVLHGYGQLANFFLRKFKILTSQGITVIAPEGLSKYYKSGTNGRVGASWMTKEDRETEIEDYINYLDLVYSNFNLNEKEVTLLGFSQGGSTAFRWFQNKTEKFENLILWASTIPTGIYINNIINTKVMYVLGNSDEYIPQSYLQLLSKDYLGIRIISFDGKHDIDENILISLTKKGA